MKFDIKSLSAFEIYAAPHPEAVNDFQRISSPGYINDKSDFPFLVIFHGTIGASIEIFKVKDRVVVRGGLDVHLERMLLFKGKLKPLIVAHETKAYPPPSLVGDSIVFLGKYNSGTAIFLYKGKYCWYPVEDFE